MTSANIDQPGRSRTRKGFFRMRMCPDDVAWEASEAMSDSWVKSLFEQGTLMAIGHFIAKHCKGNPVELCSPTGGAFNVTFKMKFEDGSAVIRFPKPGATMFSEEKIRNEVAVMTYLRHHTSIRVPRIYHWGSKEESPCGIGPFIIMEYIDHEMDLGDALNTPGLTRDDRPIIDPNIDQGKLEIIYRQMVDLLLELSKVSFSRIGSLVLINNSTWEVARRPLPLNMNELVRLGTLPRSELPDRNATFHTASAYFSTLAKLHVQHLASQRNDAIESADDCRQRFISRHLFHKLARENRLAAHATNSGPFKFWCDDLRPTNILLNENMEIVGVIDWEFSYSAPVEFTNSPPWWLLLEQPEYWPGGIEEWSKAYEPFLQTFLRVMREREDSMIEQGALHERERLSESMERSWESGDFWISYAARKNFTFDDVFWQKLDNKFFSAANMESEKWRKRLDLLDKDEKERMERLVEKKLCEMKSRVLAWEPNETLPDVE